MVDKLAFLPEWLESWFGFTASIITLGTVVMSAYFLGRRHGRARVLSDEGRKLRKARFQQLYAPLRAKLLDVHITTVRAFSYRYFRQRWQRFRRLWKSYGLRKAVPSLFDKGESWSAEVEFGRAFPLNDIRKLAKRHASVADPELLGLIQQIDREQYETIERSYQREITRAEYDLAQHIFDMYETLAREFGQAT